jgi:hypothetical protein
VTDRIVAPAYAALEQGERLELVGILDSARASLRPAESEPDPMGHDGIGPGARATLD